MDFFAAQDSARGRTRALLIYFALAVTAVVAVVYLVVTALWLLGLDGEQPFVFWDAARFAIVGSATALFIFGGTLYKVALLAKGGGVAVATSLGGRRVLADTGNLHERRLLNVVEEMSIASGVVMPQVYVLDNEWAINAFAAGFAPNRAVVAVTRGTLERLSRDELQGVVAHEFSHILNGDMRINLRLIGVLHGLLLLSLLGREIMEGTSRAREGGRLFLFGLALLVIGYVGVLLGEIIKAAISRQREYLADASAVQFTRNPFGLAGALKKIAGVAGSRVTHPRAEEASHMFFGAGAGLSSMFATHPPVLDRIHRLEPGFQPGPEAKLRDAIEREAGTRAADMLMGLQPAAFATAVGELTEPHLHYAQSLLARVPASVMDAAHSPSGAAAVLYALLLSRDGGVAAAQYGHVLAAEGETVAQHVSTTRAALTEVGPEVRLPLVDLLLPTLMQLNPEARERLIATVELLVRADGRLDAFEYTVRWILRRHLEAARPARRRRVHDVPAIRSDCEVLLSVLVHAGTRDQAAANEAFARATHMAPLEGPWKLAARSPAVFQALDAALSHLELLPARFKRRLVEACAAAVTHDGKVTVSEGELLRAVCEAIECPVPPLLPGLNVTPPPASTVTTRA